MPGCKNCRWLVTEQSICGIEGIYRSRSPLRNCVIAIILEYLDLFQPGQRILEIGCGSWSPIRDNEAKLEYQWFGIDISSKYMDSRTIATNLGSVEAIPFPDETFDWVVANQSMEHWEEYRIDLRKGLSEVFRVIKPSGWALINVPIHFHGGYRFVIGDTVDIRELFKPFSNDIHLERWRYPHEPLEPVRYNLNKYKLNKYLKNKSSYILDIRAQRKEIVPYYCLDRISVQRKLWLALKYRGPAYYSIYFSGRVLNKIRNISMGK
jgi:SAM-dependent methyltransferase